MHYYLGLVSIYSSIKINIKVKTASTLLKAF